MIVLRADVDKVILRNFKRFLKENGMWGFISNEIKKEHGSIENFLVKIRYYGWRQALRHTLILKFPFGKSQGNAFSDKEWLDFWNDTDTKWGVICLDIKKNLPENISASDIFHGTKQDYEMI